MSVEIDKALANPTVASVEDALGEAISSMVFEGAPNCTFVALTNVAATAANPDVQTDLLTKQAGGEDVRSLYKRSIRPALQHIAKKLGVAFKPSSDPFVSNPFREAQIDNAWVERRKNKLAGAEELRVIVSSVAADRGMAKVVLAGISKALLAKLEQGKISYNLPPRMTVALVSEILNGWMGDQSSGGSRLEIAATALLRFTGAQMERGWDQVESHQVNAPTPYDQVCRRRDKVLALGECKDQEVTPEHVFQLAEEMRKLDCSRGYIFTRTVWQSRSDIEALRRAIADRSVLGYRIDLVDVSKAIDVWLPLIDQADRDLVDFMNCLTAELDRHGALADRRDLANRIDAALR
ncbi:MAG: hypothetical protein ABJP34_03590 [Erythrobacter sp.]